MLNNATDWIWYQGTDGSSVPDSNTTYHRAREYIDVFMLGLEQEGIPFERIYCHVTYTINLVFPRHYAIDIGVKAILRDARFEEKPMPKGVDLEASKDLREALLGGSQMNKVWH